MALIGPLPIPGDVIGGTKVSFANLVSGLHHRSHYRVQVIDSSRPTQGKSRIAQRWLDMRGMVRVLWRLWRVAERSQVVMWNSSPGGAMLAAPLIRAICVLRRRPLIVRLFGGDFDDFYDRSSRLKRWLAGRCLLEADLVLLQTRDLAKRFENRTWVEWFPTTRDMRARIRPLPTECRRFLFIGQLRPQKGIHEILKVSRILPSEIEITIAGPAMAGFDVTAFEDDRRVRYLGALDPEDVPDVVEAHDALLFPSYYEGEGYPGVVVEALQLGLPVVTTDWRALPELVEHERSGLLVPPRDKDALLGAMRRLVDDQVLFHELQIGATERGDAFRGEHALEKLESWINELIGR